MVPPQLQMNGFTWNATRDDLDTSRNMTNSNETASNHYMMALKYSNPSIDPEQLCQKCVIILGAGNVGSEIAEKLTRCGIGKLILFDYDIDEVVRARMSVFVPYQENSARVFTLSKKLATLNSQLKIEQYNYNVASIPYYDLFLNRVKHGSLTDDQIDLILDCSSDVDIQMTTNKVCTEVNQQWVSSMCKTPMSAEIRLYEPGRTACFNCAQLSLLNNDYTQASQQENLCPDYAILPSTSSILAGILTQMTMKLLLKFGTVQDSIQYNALTDTFLNSTYTPNGNCSNRACCQWQEEHRNKLISVAGGNQDLVARNLNSPQEPTPVLSLPPQNMDRVLITSKKPAITSTPNASPSSEQQVMNSNLPMSNEPTVSTILDAMAPPALNLQETVATALPISLDPTVQSMSSQPFNVAPAFVTEVLQNQSISFTTPRLRVHALTTNDKPTTPPRNVQDSTLSRKRPQPTAEQTQQSVKAAFTTTNVQVIRPASQQTPRQTSTPSVQSQFKYPFRFIGIADNCDTIDTLKNIKYPKVHMAALILGISKDNIMYPACTNQTCRRGVEKMSVGHYKCLKCGIRSKFRPAYRVEMTIGDFTGYTKIVLFETAATSLFKKSADDMDKLMRQNFNAYNKLVQSLLYRMYDFEIGYNLREFNGRIGKKIVCNSCSPCNLNRYHVAMKKTLDKISLL